ncbi:MAG TPA: N,N-dimethylformamidase beta subunit family domain-containing protein [Caulobacteraceae bacterium]|nr:N,N-dimethylformamidase beta subunit family domain-containing protein [Caulobacteraceae bacterium]
MSTNPIVIENQKPGTPDSIWDAPTSPDEIEGFATDISVNHGDTVSFKINVNAALGANVPYHIEIYRLGYYGGDGATLVTTINGLHGTNQPNPITDPTTGEVDAGNWSVSASWTTPATAVSGVYIARLVLDGGGSASGDSNQIPFIVRDDGGKSDVVFQTSDPTWQAYNGWGGNNGQVGANFYGGSVSHPPVADPGLGSQSRTFAVSYNRPLITNGPAAGTQDSLMGAEYAGIYWLEENGYDVSYIAGLDTDRLGVNALLGHKVYLSVGHDEYWSGNQRANVTAARDAGVNLAFLSGNEVYWKTRYAASTATTDGSPTADRTLICYKETWDYNNPSTAASAYQNDDPSDQWTGTWIDGRFATSTDASGKLDAIGGGNPPNSLTGQLFAADGTGAVGPGITVTAPESQLRFWKNTTVAANGGVTNLAPGILGYEFDASPYDATTPSDLIHLSDTTVTWSAVLSDQGNHEPAGPVTHQLSLYKAPSGALVFGAGTVFWTWGLSDQHGDQPYGGTIANPTIQQATVNLLAEMGAQPQTLQANLVLASTSTDTIAPHATIAVNGAPPSVSIGQSVTIGGTAIDDNNSTNPTDYGNVAAVQVSTDDGATWSVANQTPSTTTTGAVNWTYTFAASGGGEHTLLVRPIDDSLNMQNDVTKLASAQLLVSAGAAGTGVGLFNPTDGPPAGVNEFVFDDSGSSELGVRFESDVAGTINQIKYYRAGGDTDYGTREGHLWAPDGTLLGTAIFTATPGSNGWQTATFTTPIVVQANTVYTASYHTAGDYISTHNYFLNTYTSPSGYLSAPGGGDGVYAISATPVDPTNSYLGSNYWVDVTFVPSNTSSSPLQITSAANYAVSDDQTAVATVTATDTASSALTYSIVPVANGGAADGGLFQIDPSSGVLTFISAPEFETPADATANNVYDVTVAALDQAGNLQQQNLAVTVTPTAEAPPVASTPVFDGRAVEAQYIDGQYPTALIGLPGDTQTGTVGPSGTGFEFASLPYAGLGNGAYGLATIDITSSTIRVAFPLDPNAFPSGEANFNSQPYNGVLVTFPNGLPANFTGFSIVSQAGFTTPLSASNITVTGNSVFVNVSGNERAVNVDPDPSGPLEPSYVLLQANYSGTANPLITSNGGGAAASVTMSDKTSLVTDIQASETGFGGAFTYAIVPASGGGGADSGLFEIINGDELRFRNEPDGLSPPMPAAPGPYQVTVEASDGQGGFVQQTLSVTLFAETNHPDSKMSGLIASPGTLTADGVTTTTLTVTVEDSAGAPLRGQEVELSASGSNNTFGAIIGVTDMTGTFTTTLSSTLAQAETISASENTAQETIPVEFTAGGPSANNSILTASSGPVMADGVSTTTLTVTVRDAHGNPVVGQTVTLSGDSASNIFGAAEGSSGQTDANGVFQTTLASTLARTEAVTASEGGGVQEQASVTFIGGPPSSGTSTLAASGGPVTADGVQTFALTVTIKDASGNPAANQLVMLSGDGSNNGFGVDNLATITGVTDSNGVFNTTVDSTLARMEMITAAEAGASETTSVTFTAGAPSAVTSSLVAAQGAVDASGSYTTTLTLAVKDANDNPVANQAVTLAGAGTAFGTSSGSISGVTDLNGLFTTAVSANLAQTPSITATITPMVQVSLSLASTGVPSATTSTLTSSAASAVADGVSPLTLTVTVLDAQGDTLAGQAVTLSGDGSDNLFGPAGFSGTTNASGVFTTTLASDVAQGETITTTIAGTVQETVGVAFTTAPPPTVTTPTITGTAQEGQTLTAIGATDPNPGDTISYQWQLNGQPITGQTGSTYTVQEGDETGVITVAATATDAQTLTASATSAPTPVVTDAAPTVTDPTVVGVAREGQVLTASASSGQSDNVVAYQWQTSTDGGTTWNPVGAGATYAVQETDEGAQIEVVATATNDQNATVSATSTPTLAVVDAAPSVTTPTISGTAQEGQVLTASASATDSDNTITYQWKSSTNGGTTWSAIVGAMGSTYSVQETDENALIEVVATATNAQSLTNSATSLATLTVIDAAPSMTTPTIAGTAQEGQVLTASGAAAGQIDNPVSYQWKSSTNGGTTWSNIAGATGPTYAVQEADEEALIEVVATTANAQGLTASATSLPTLAVLDAAPTIGSVSIGGTAQQGQLLTASATGSRPDDTVSFQWQLNGGAISGATGSTFLVGAADVGGTITVVGTSTNDNSVALSTTSAPTAPVQPPPPPLLSNSGAAASYLLGRPAVAIAPSMVLIDTESATVTSATISINSGFLAGDQLNFTSTGTIAGVYNAATGVLSLSGTASTSAYQAALDSITYSSSAKDATGHNTDDSRGLTISVTDGQQSSNVLPVSLTLTKPTGAIYTLTTGIDTITGGYGDDTVSAPAGTLGPGDSINTGGGFDTLVLQGVGSFNLGVPKTLVNIDLIDVNEAQASTGALAAAQQALTLRAGLNSTVNVLPPSPASAGMASGITIVGANNSSTIDLGAGTDIVTLGSAAETVNGGAGPDTVNATSATAKALIKAGAGSMTVNVSGGGSTALNAGDSGLTALNLAPSAAAYAVNAAGLAGLTITDSSNTKDIISGVAASDVVNDGAASVLVQASAASAGLVVIGGAGTDVLEITTGGTVGLNALTSNVQVKLDAATNLTLSSGVNAVIGVGNDTINATAANVTATTSLNVLGLNNTLVLTGGGAFQLGAPKTLGVFQTLDVFEGQAASGSIPSTVQTVTLRAGQAATVNILGTALNPSNPNPATITIIGANDSDRINLGAGADSVTLGSAKEVLNGGAGADVVNATAVTIGALLKGGAGSMTVNLAGGGSMALNAGDSGLTALNLAPSATAYSLNTAGVAGLTINDNGATKDTLSNVAASDVINDGAASVLVQATAANAAGLQVVGGAGTDILEITTGGTVALNPLTSKVQVKLDAATTLTLPSGVNAVTGGSGNDTIMATAANITGATSLNVGGPNNTLVLSGAGAFQLGLPTLLGVFQTVDVFDGQAASGSLSSTLQTITLRAGQAATVNVLGAAVNPSNPNPATITIIGANDSDRINLGGGADTVTLGSTHEVVNGGAGTDVVNATAATIGAIVKGGAGSMTVNIAGGGAVVMNAADAGVGTVNLQSASANYSFTANAEAGLVIDDQSAGLDTLVAGGANETLTGGAAGRVTMVAAAAGKTTISDAAAVINGDQIQHFSLTSSNGNVIDVTDMSYASLSSATFTENSARTAGQLTLAWGAHTATISLFGQYMAAGASGTAALAGFTIAGDGHGGTSIMHTLAVSGG